MASKPTEEEIWDQWARATDILETLRVVFDDDIASDGGKIDLLIQDLKGEFLPAELTRFTQNVRGGCSGLVSGQLANAIISPVLNEYAQVLKDAAVGEGYGSGYTNAGQLFRALYEWFIANDMYVTTRAITFDTVTPVDPSYTGDVARLLDDENDKTLEAVTVEKKQIRCRADANSGAQKWAEVFEIIGSQASYDSLLRGEYGSGTNARNTLTSLHAGSGNGGSWLQNSSFSSYSGTGTPKFAGWDEFAGSGNVSQDPVFYNTFPNAQTDASLRIASGGGTTTLRQTMANMRLRRFDAAIPYFLRAMINADSFSAAGGNFVLRLGTSERTIDIDVDVVGNGWVEVIIPIDYRLWLRSFNTEDLAVEIEWNGPTGGDLLVDDLILSPMTPVDGTWWAIRQNGSVGGAGLRPWLIDDQINKEDFGGLPGTGILQYWLWVAGYGSLPSSGILLVPDPPIAP